MAGNERYAGNFMEKLANDPKYQAMRREQDAKRAEFRAMLDRDQAALVQELRDVGVHVAMNNIPGQEYAGPPNSVWDLVNSSISYPEAIPVLIRHMGIEHHPRIQEGIVRALAVVEARDVATERLIEEFVSIDDPDSNYKWAVGLALATTTTPKTATKVAALALDKSHGKSRSQLPLGLVNGNLEESCEYLQQMLEDPVTKANAQKAIKQLERKHKKP